MVALWIQKSLNRVGLRCLCGAGKEECGDLGY